MKVDVTKIPNLTSDGFVKTTGGDGSLTVDTSTYLTAEADTLQSVTDRGATTNVASEFTESLTARKIDFGIYDGGHLFGISATEAIMGQGVTDSAGDIVSTHADGVTVEMSAGSFYIKKFTGQSIDFPITRNTMFSVLNDGTVKINALTTDGFVKTSGGDGTLSIDTSTYITGPAGSNTDIQFNSSGAFGVDTGKFTYFTDGSLSHLSVGGQATGTPWVNATESGVDIISASVPYFLLGDGSTNNFLMYYSIADDAFIFGKQSVGNWLTVLGNSGYVLINNYLDDSSGAALQVTGSVNISSGSSYMINGVAIGGGPSLGTTTQIPYMNGTDDDFIYDAGFVYDGTSLTYPQWLMPSLTANDTLYIDNSYNLINTSAPSQDPNGSYAMGHLFTVGGVQKFLFQADFGYGYGNRVVFNTPSGSGRFIIVENDTYHFGADADDGSGAQVQLTGSMNIAAGQSYMIGGVPIGGGAPGGSQNDIQINDGAGGFTVGTGVSVIDYSGTLNALQIANDYPHIVTTTNNGSRFCGWQMAESDGAGGVQKGIYFGYDTIGGPVANGTRWFIYSNEAQASLFVMDSANAKFYMGTEADNGDATTRLQVNGRLDVMSNTIINVTDPSNAQDAATKNYVDTQGFLTSYTETDPVVGAVTGIVVSDGAGNISAITDSSTNWDAAYTHSGVTTGNPHSVTVAEVESASSITPVADGTYAVYNDGTTTGQVTSFTTASGIITAITVLP